MLFRRRHVAALLAALGLLSSCISVDDAPTAETFVGKASLALLPKLSSSAASTAAEAGPISRVRITATQHQKGRVLTESTQEVDPSADAWTLDVSVPIPAGGGMAVLTFELISVDGDGKESVEFSGETDPIRLVSGPVTHAADVVLGRGPVENIPVTRVAARVESATIAIGGETEVRAEASTRGGSGGTKIYFAALDESVATVDDGGRVVGVQLGEARIVAAAGRFADTATVQVVPPVADLDVAMRLQGGKKGLQGGDTIEYSVEVVNHGPWTATEIQIRSDADDGLTLLSGAPDVGVIAFESGVWVIDSLGARGRARMQLTARIDEGAAGILWNRARSLGLARQSDTISANDADSVSVEVAAAETEAHVSVSQTLRTHGGSLLPGDTVDIDVTVSNAGPARVSAVHVSNGWDEGLTPAASTAALVAADAGRGWSTGALAAREKHTTRLRFVISDDAAGRNVWTRTTITAVEGALDSDPTGHADSLSLAVDAPQVDLVVWKTVRPINASVGDTLLWTIRITNQGPSTAHDIVGIEAPDADLGVDSVWVDLGTLDESRRAWRVPELKKGETATLGARTLVTEDMAGKTLWNRAILESVAEADRSARNNADSAKVVIKAATKEKGKPAGH